MLHNIAFDFTGRITLAEFMRLAGLLAVDAADANDLAVEFAGEEMTLNLTADELGDAQACRWYEQVFAAYNVVQEATETPAGAARDELERKAVAAYEALISEAAEFMLELAGTREVAVTEIAPVLPLRPRA